MYFAIDGGVVLAISATCVLAVLWLARHFQRSGWFAVVGLLPALIYFPAPAVVLYGVGGVAMLLLACGALRLLRACIKRP